MARFSPDECEGCTFKKVVMGYNQGWSEEEGRMVDFPFPLHHHCKKNPKVFAKRLHVHDAREIVPCNHQTRPTEWACARSGHVVWAGITYCNLFEESKCDPDKCPGFVVPITQARK